MAQYKPVEFENNENIGEVEKTGYFKYDPEEQAYYIAGGGENMWAGKDAFHFAWKRMKGDFILTTDLKILGEGGDLHRKAGWMIRQNLNADAPYVDAVVHGDGLTSLQFRKEKGAETSEITNPDIISAHTIRLEKKGDTYIMHGARKGDPLTKIGEITVNLNGPLYVGLAITAHQKGGFEQARFSNTRITIPVEAKGDKSELKSRLETVNIHTGLRKVVYQENTHFEAPNWSRNGKYFIYNSHGLLYKLQHDDKDGKPSRINTGFADQCNNDHGISFDGTTLAISHRSEETKNSIIYTLPVTGGTPTQITPKGPSYWHGWSPDGKTLTYCAERNGEYDVYIIPSDGGREKKLTSAQGLDDGPEYSYDGEYIYFNSVRTGTMQIWRMKPDGSNQEQITFDEYNNWFPHISPDGKTMVFLSYLPEVPADSHPFYKHVYIRKMPVDGGEPEVIARLYGGQGTINVPSWSPDSNEVAFVSYTFTE